MPLWQLCRTRSSLRQRASIATPPLSVQGGAREGASMNQGSMPELSWEAVDRLAAAVAAAGRRAGLPYVAVQSDLGDPKPMTDGNGHAYAESLPWVDAGAAYWRDRALALRSSFLLAARVFAEPIWF